MYRMLKFILREDKDLLDYSQNQGCWWPGSLRCQGISSHGINPVHPEEIQAPHNKG